MVSNPIGIDPQPFQETGASERFGELQLIIQVIGVIGVIFTFQKETCALTLKCTHPTNVQGSATNPNKTGVQLNRDSKINQT